jgi:serine/threonine protein kinase/tetratricopeptide (TPR) repeat protein
MALATGSRIGAYEILAPLGAGGMGEVYRARDSRLEREVAVKVLPSRLLGDEGAQKRFAREARMLATLSHPNILSVYDFVTEGDQYCVVAELLEGETLRTRLSGGILQWRRATEIGISIAEGLAAAHAKGVIHRDLKPDNVFLTGDGRVKVLDFGLARSLPFASPDDDTAPTAVHLTQPGTVLGTVGYMSPEQARGAAADGRSDVFSLGCVLYEMVAGRAPFERETAAETIAAILKEEPPYLTGSGELVPAELERVLLHCLEKSAEQRFQTARDLAFALDALLKGSGAAQTPFPGKRTGRRSRLIDTLAVLPFANATGDPDAEYLSDGITETLINSLSQLPKLRVTARTTVFRYKGRNLPPQMVGQDLGVRAVLTGTLAQRGDSLVMQVDLVDAADGAQLWGEQFNRQSAELFVMQEELAQRILEKLRLRLTGDEKKKVTKRHTQNVQAYQLYMKGRFYWNRRTPDGFRQAIEYFNQATLRDPEYALAHSGLADCFSLLSFYGALPPKVGYQRARAAAARALEIDDSLAEAHASLACGLLYHAWDGDGAERSFQRALALNPNYATARQWHAQMLMAQGKLGLALDEIQRAQELDPLSFVISASLGMVLYASRRFDDAVREHRNTLELEPNFLLARALLGMSLIEARRPEDAVTELERARTASGGAALALGMLGHVYARVGQEPSARQMLAELEQRGQNAYVSPFRNALVCAGLRDTEQTLYWLGRAREERSDWLLFVGVTPGFDWLHADPRMDAFRRLLDTPVA